MDKQTVLALRGLPASGKSTYALQFVKENPNYVRINRDTIRDMIGHSFSKNIEKVVKSFRNVMISDALLRGYNVIIDDTNLSERNIRYMEQLSNTYKCDLIIDDRFMKIDLQTLLERNKNREKKVPEQVIIDMFNKFVSEETYEYKNVKPVFKYDDNKKNAIICDIDGTLALHWNRSPFEFNRVDEDVINVPVIELINRMNYDDVEFLVVSGREGTKECRHKTMTWLIEHLPDHIKTFKLFMRKEGDFRKDYIIKTELYEENIKDDYNVLFVLDDRNQTVENWRTLGLPCFQVNYGNF